MATRGRDPVIVTLTDSQRAELDAMVDEPTTRDGMRVRARIVLLAAEGESNTEIAQRLGASPTTVAPAKGA